MVDINTLTKLYYSIGEVAEMFGENTSLIRFWETEFPSINPKKNKRGNRLYTAKDIAEIQEIHQLVKERGFTLEGARNARKKKTSSLKEVLTARTGKDEIIEKLEGIREKLLALK